MAKQHGKQIYMISIKYNHILADVEYKTYAAVTQLTVDSIKPTAAKISVK